MKMIRNFYEVSKRQITSHEGEGKVELYEMWDKPEFNDNVDFFDRVVMPPKTSMGYHKHENTTEMYIILEGTGTITIEGEEHAIKKGDMIKNPPYGSHGLKNDSDSDLDLLVLQITNPE